MPRRTCPAGHYPRIVIPFCLDPAPGETGNPLASRAHAQPRVLSGIGNHRGRSAPTRFRTGRLQRVPARRMHRAMTEVIRPADLSSSRIIA